MSRTKYYSFSLCNTLNTKRDITDMLLTYICLKPKQMIKLLSEKCAHLLVLTNKNVPPPNIRMMNETFLMNSHFFVKCFS